MCAFNQLCAARTKWSTVRMEMHTTSTTTPDIPAASSYGFAASPFRHHGQPVAQQAAGGGRSTADDAAPTAG